MVLTRTVAPDWMRSTGGARAEIYPQTTVSGVEPKVTSGLFPAGAGCAAADATRTNTPSTAHHSISDLETCLDIESTLSSNWSSTDCFESLLSSQTLSVNSWGLKSVSLGAFFQRGRVA